MPQQIKHEVCYRLTENSSLDNWLEGLDLTVSTSASNEYFDDSDCSFYKKSIFIKLKNNSLLEIKSNTAHLTSVQATNAIQCRTFSFPLRKHMFDPKQLVKFNELEAIIGIKRPLPFSFAHFHG